MSGQSVRNCIILDARNTGQHLTKNMDLGKPQRLTVLSREFLQVSARRILNQVRHDVGLDKRKPT